jgi:hypothetical protein
MTPYAARAIETSRKAFSAPRPRVSRTEWAARRTANATALSAALPSLAWTIFLISSKHLTDRGSGARTARDILPRLRHSDTRAVSPAAAKLAGVSATVPGKEWRKRYPVSGPLPQAEILRCRTAEFNACPTPVSIVKMERANPKGIQPSRV